MKDGFRIWGSVAGLVAGVLGMVTVAFAFVWVPPRLARVVRDAESSVSDAAGQVRMSVLGLDSVQQAADSMDQTSVRMDRVLLDLESATASLGEGLQSLSEALAFMPGSNFKRSSGQLSQSAQAFGRLSAQMKESRETAARMSDYARQLQAGVRGSRRGVDAAVTVLDSAADGIGNAKNALNRVFYAFAALLMLLFAGIAALSIGGLARR